MKLEDVLTLIKAVEETDFDKFELSDQEFALKLERRNYRLALEREGVPFVVGSAESLPVATAPPVPALEQSPAQEASEDVPAGAKEITSPLIGVFHELPDGKAVKPGDQIKKGDVICMVEAMKLMNEILMPEDGEIVEVAVQDNAMVEYGDLLYRFV